MCTEQADAYCVRTISFHWAEGRELSKPAPVDGNGRYLLLSLQSLAEGPATRGRDGRCPAGPAQAIGNEGPQRPIQPAVELATSIALKTLLGEISGGLTDRLRDT